MSQPLKDPEGIETHYLLGLNALYGARVLEIGAGEGRMTWRYADLTRHVVAVDLDTERLATALRDRPAALAERVSIASASGEALPFRDQSFDVVLLAWSL